MKTNRQRCYQIAERLCQRIAFVSLSDLPDLPCLMNALDAMEDAIAYDQDVSISQLEEIAEDAVFEILESEGFPI